LASILIVGSSPVPTGWETLAVPSVSEIKVIYFGAGILYLLAIIVSFNSRLVAAATVSLGIGSLLGAFDRSFHPATPEQIWLQTELVVVLAYAIGIGALLWLIVDVRREFSKPPERTKGSSMPPVSLAPQSIVDQTPNIDTALREGHILRSQGIH